MEENDIPLSKFALNSLVSKDVTVIVKWISFTENAQNVAQEKSKLLKRVTK